MKKTLTFLFFISVCIVFVQAQGNAKLISPGATHTVYCDIDNYEPNNSILKASVISAVDVHFALICDQTDVDWYVITVPANTSSLKIMATDCARDYDMEIYDIHSKVLAASNERGVTNEKIFIANPVAGDYYVKIFGYNNEFDMYSTYALRYFVTPFPLPVANNSVLRTQPGTDVKELNMYPNPAINNVKLTYTATSEGILSINIYDHVGRIMNKISDLHGEGYNVHNLDVSYLPNGFYMVEVIVNNERQLKKLTINKK